MRSGLSLLFLAFTLMNLIGCATGQGINRHAFFDPKAPLTLPFRIEVDKQMQSTEVGAKMGEGSEFQLFVVGGLPALAMLKIPGAVGGIRGKFAVGETFARYARSLSNPDPTKQTDTLNLKLVYFQQYLIPGMSPRMKALLKFKADLQNSGEVTYSGYSFDWEGHLI